MIPTVAEASQLTVAFPTPWPIASEGLTVDDNGRLGLATVPTLPDLPAGSTDPAGTHCNDLIRGVVATNGRMLFSDIGGGAIGVVDCAGGIRRFGAVSAGSGPGLVREVAGLAIGANNTLLVADRGNNRVQEFDLTTGQLLWIWAAGLVDVEDVTVVGGGTVLAAAADGVVALQYNRPTQIIVTTADLGARPHSLHQIETGGNKLVVSVGLDQPRLMCFEQADDGSWHRHGSSRLQIALDRAVGRRAGDAPPPVPTMTGPVAVSGFASRLYVSSCRGETAAVVDLSLESVLGVIPPLTNGAVAPAGIGVDECGTLLATDGRTAASSTGSVPVAVGRARIGPIPLALDPDAAHWLRIRATGRLGPTSASVEPTFSPRHWVPGAERDGAAEAHDKRVEVPPRADGVTLDVELRRGAAVGQPGPYLDRLELRIDEPGLIELLPAVYRGEGDPEAFLDPFLRLAQSSSDDLIHQLFELPAQFDPATATDDLHTPWLDWLATWVDARLDETWSMARRREAVKTAFDRHAVGGTASALAGEIEAELGIDQVTIVEPGDLASIWILGDSGAQLGLTTMTGAAPPGGSIGGVTATVDGSHLIGPADFGAPLFGDLAHCFVVRVRESDIASTERRSKLEALIEREKPALSHAHVCVVEPGIRLGLQGSIGVDAVIGPPQDPRAVGGLQPLGEGHDNRPLPEPSTRGPSVMVIP